MEIAQGHRDKIEGIIAEMDCPIDVKCYRGELDNLTKVRMLANDAVIECLEKNRRLCKFELPFGETFFCICRLRQYIAKNLHR